jgi:hypothetical protein
MDHGTACCFKKQQSVERNIDAILSATVEIAALTHTCGFSNSARVRRIAHLPLDVRVPRAKYWLKHFLMDGFSTTAL